MVDMNNIKIGDKLWFSDWRTNRIVYGFVMSKSESVICLEGDMNDTNESFKRTESFIGNRRCEWFEVYTSKEELINASKSSFEKEVEAYKAEITDTDSLLAFPLKNDLTSDYAAETAYKEKAIEFGFNIEYEENIELD